MITAEQKLPRIQKGATLNQAIDSAAGFCPVFVLPGALNARAEAIGEQLVSHLLAVRQPQPRPAAVMAIDGDGFVDMRESIIDAVTAAPGRIEPQATLRQAYLDRTGALRRHADVSLIAEGALADGQLQALFFETDAAAVLAVPALVAAASSACGPAGLLVRCRDDDEYLQLAQRLPPCAAICLQVEDGDDALGARLAPALMALDAPILCNRFPPLLPTTPHVPT